MITIQDVLKYMHKTRKMASSLPNPEKRGLNKIAEIRSLSAWCIFPPTNPICEKGGAWGGAVNFFFVACRTLHIRVQEIRVHEMAWCGWVAGEGLWYGGGGQAALAMVSVSSLCYQSLLRMKGFWVGLGEGSLEHMLDVVSPSAATLFPRERGREREREGT